MYCSRCGKKVPPQSRFCPYCGIQRGAADTNPTIGPSTDAEDADQQRQQTDHPVDPERAPRADADQDVAADHPEEMEVTT